MGGCGVLFCEEQEPVVGAHLSRPADPTTQRAILLRRSGIGGKNGQVLVRSAGRDKCCPYLGSLVLRPYKNLTPTPREQQDI